ncbi:hypothetical protein AnigIFM63326_004500 [Aspergillus niger]|nr:hypothetical protein AnigIFM63326_004500 [Aspergillus niger]
MALEFTPVHRLATTERGGITQWPGAASSSTLGSLYPSCAVTDCHGAKVVGAVVSAATAAGAPDGCGSMSRGEKCGNDGKDILELAEDIDDAIIWVCVVDKARIVLVLVTSARTILMRYLLDMTGQECEASKLLFDKAPC